MAWNLFDCTTWFGGNTSSTPVASCSTTTTCTSAPTCTATCSDATIGDCSGSTGSVVDKGIDFIGDAVKWFADCTVAVVDWFVDCTVKVVDYLVDCTVDVVKYAVDTTVDCFEILTGEETVASAASNAVCGAVDLVTGGVTGAVDVVVGGVTSAVETVANGVEGAVQVANGTYGDDAGCNNPPADNGCSFDSGSFDWGSIC